MFHLDYQSLIKVEFPEARIYEETLNCLLYENRTGPDQDLMQATSHRQAADDFWQFAFLSMFFLFSRPPGDGYTSNDEDDRNRGAGEGGASGGGGAVGGASGGSVSQRHSSGLSRLRSSKNS